MGTKREQKSLRRLQTIFLLGMAIALGAFCIGCGTVRSGRAWGENAVYPVDWHRIPQVAKNAALDPITWLPLVGAGMVAAGGWDHHMSDWAVGHTPLFGSQDGARDYSDVG